MPIIELQGHPVATGIASDLMLANLHNTDFKVSFSLWFTDKMDTDYTIASHKIV